MSVTRLPLDLTRNWPLLVEGRNERRPLGWSGRRYLASLFSSSSRSEDGSLAASADRATDRPVDLLPVAAMSSSAHDAFKCSDRT